MSTATRPAKTFPLPNPTSEWKKNTLLLRRYEVVGSAKDQGLRNSKSASLSTSALNTRLRFLPALQRCISQWLRLTSKPAMR